MALDRKLLLDSYYLANKDSIDLQILEQGWNPSYLKVTGFQQDVSGCKYIDEDGNEVYVEPTFNWNCRIYSQRLKDGEFFYCNIKFLNEELDLLEKSVATEEIIFHILDEDFSNAIATMKEFSICDCNSESHCEKHK